MDDAGRFGVLQRLSNDVERWRTHKTLQGKLQPAHENSICYKYSCEHNKYEPTNQHTYIHTYIPTKGQTLL